MGKNYSFNANKESLKNQKLSDYEIMDFVSKPYRFDTKRFRGRSDYDYVKYTKFRTQQLKDII